MIQVVNRVAQALALPVQPLAPYETRTYPRNSTVLESPTMVAQLSEYLRAGLVSVVIDGESVTAEQLAGAATSAPTSYLPPVPTRTELQTLRSDVLTNGSSVFVLLPTNQEFVYNSTVTTPANGTTVLQPDDQTSPSDPGRWLAVDAGSGYVPATRTVSTTLPLVGGGDLTTNRTLALQIDPTLRVASGHLAVTYGIVTDTALEGSRDALYPLLDGTRMFSGPLNVGGFNVKHSASPIDAFDLATKEYVDSVAHGLDPKDSATVATVVPLPTYLATTNVLTGAIDGVLPAIDGITLAAGIGQHVLVKSEVGADSANNGWYDIASVGSVSTPWVLTRRVDARQGSLTTGAFGYIDQGNVNASTSWSLITPDPIIVGTTLLEFTQIAGPGVYLAGNGLLLTGRVFSVVYGSLASTAAEGNDPRLSDARVPTGAASGDLGGNYPNPTVVGLTFGANNEQGAIPFRGASTWQNLAAALPGQVLRTQGPALDPEWGTLSYFDVLGAVGTTDARLTNPRVPTGIAGGDLSGTYPSPSVTGLSITAAQGDILFRGAGGWEVLSPGTAGQVLQTNGVSADPSWSSAGIITYGTPVATGLANSAGVATTVARSDHVHDSTVITTRLVSANTSLSATTDEYLLVNTSGGAISIALPNPATKKRYVIRDRNGTFNTNACTLTRFGSELIDGLAANRTFEADFGGWELFSDGTDWYTE